MTQIVPSGPACTTFPDLRMFTSLAHGARRSIRVVSPYSVPEESLLGALTGAAISGVDVEVYVSEEADQAMVDNAQSSYDEQLLEAWGRTEQYPKPAVLHTTCMIVDEEADVFGSSDMDIRSFVLDFEISALTTDAASVRMIAAVVGEYRALSRVLDPRAFRRRPLRRRWTVPSSSRRSTCFSKPGRSSLICWQGVRSPAAASAVSSSAWVITASPPVPWRPGIRPPSGPASPAGGSRGARGGRGSPPSSPRGARELRDAGDDLDAHPGAGRFPR